MFSLTYFTAPNPPPSFSIQVDLNRSKPRNLYLIYVDTLGEMISICQKGWHSPWVDEPVISSLSSGMEILVRKVKPTVARNQLENSHVTLGLYRGFLEMTAGLDFCDPPITIGLQRHNIGTISFQERTLVMEGYRTVDNMTAPQLIDLNITSTNEGGRIVDLRDDRSVLIYKWDETRINSKDVLTAFMDMYMILAERGGNTPFS